MNRMPGQSAVVTGAADGDIPPAPAPRTSRRGALGALAVLTTSPLAALMSACGGGGGDAGGAAPVPAPTPAPAPTPSTVNGPPWRGFGGDARHTAVGAMATQALTRIVWQTPVDETPPYTAGGALLAHYGSPVITARNTVILPVKTTRTGDFRIEARAGADGVLLWSMLTDYVLPAHNWVPALNPVLAGTRVAIPAAGGRVILRDDPDSPTGASRRVAFFGDSVYAAGAATYDAVVRINTPLTADSAGNVFFGFAAVGANAAGLTGGVARLGADGSVRYVAGSAASADAAILRTANNAAPALSIDERTLYVVLRGTTARGVLVALDSATLATVATRALLDPQTRLNAVISDDATASPMVGPDGHVFIGVLESSAGQNNYRGWLLHFDATLQQSYAPGDFGWDNTPSVVPLALVPSYNGPASYLICTKYNDYGGFGGSGLNRVAILDPVQTQPNATSRTPVMREVQTVLGVTADADVPGGVKEWCINTAAVDPLTQSVLMNSEDGFLYRWHLPSNSLSQKLSLDSGYGQSYTPTLIGPDGRVYAVNNARLFSVGV